MVALVGVYVKKPFRKYVNNADAGHNGLVLNFPVLTIMLLISYFANSTAGSTAIFLLLLTASLVFLFIKMTVRMSDDISLPFRLKTHV